MVIGDMARNNMINVDLYKQLFETITLDQRVLHFECGAQTLAYKLIKLLLTDLNKFTNENISFAWKSIDIKDKLETDQSNEFYKDELTLNDCSNNVIIFHTSTNNKTNKTLLPLRIGEHTLQTSIKNNEKNEIEATIYDSIQQRKYVIKQNFVYEEFSSDMPMDWNCAVYVSNKFTFIKYAQPTLESPLQQTNIIQTQNDNSSDECDMNNNNSISDITGTNHTFFCTF